MKIRENKISQTEEEKDKIIKGLYKYPNIFTENPELVELLTPPSSKKKNILDMQEYMITSLQKNCQDLREKNNFLLNLSKENLSNQEKIHNAVLSILSSKSLNDTFERILNKLPKLLDVDNIFLCLQEYGSDQSFTDKKNIKNIEPEQLQDLIGAKTCILTNNLENSYLSMLGIKKNDFKSFAIILISGKIETFKGILVFASKQKSTFDQSKGTILLEFLSKIISSYLNIWLKN
tara:strand:+ start:1023 stop:1724 length:702 start_codon:yes stop_codon:yes gene_type:complete